MSEEFTPLIYGDITSSLWDLFQQHAGSNGVLTQCQIRQVLNSIGLFPTKSQIYELVHCACECAGRCPVDHITFGEFCVFVTELQELYRKNAPASAPRSQLREKAVLAMEERRKKRRLSGSHNRFKVDTLTGDQLNCIVFLGGSCNPTTWRHDIAIPFLKEHEITFYNPQVSNWKPELMEIEDQAKQTAELLFFVIDNQTRSTASMVEAAYLGGCGRQLILIIKGFSDHVVIFNEQLTQIEIEDLERSHAYLTDLVERQGIPVFSDLNVALKCTAKCVQQNLRVSELTLEDGAMPVRFPHLRVANRIIKLKDVFNAIDSDSSGRLSFQDIKLCYKTITDEELPNNIPGGKSFYTFEDFCAIISEYRYKRRTMVERMMSGIVRLPHRLYHWMRGTTEMRNGEPEPRRRDVFLGGTCGKSTWREDIAMPTFRKHGISYFNPQLPEWSTRYIPLEAAVKDSCRLLLYVITGDTRGITSMLEAGHFIGQTCNIVLCIQQMPDGTVIHNEELTHLAVKDYNRARAYLSDLANRDGIPVFDEVEEAVSCVVEKLKDSSTALT